MTREIIRLSTDTGLRAWSDTLEKCGNHDVYHTAEYHLAARDQGLGEPALLVVEEPEGLVAMPLLIRAINPELTGESVQYDATSVYGYGGPVTSVAAELSRQNSVTDRFGNEIVALMEELELVSFFTRLHPLVDTAWVFNAIGKTRTVGPTVVIDLAEPAEVQQNNIRKGHRYSIKKALKSGVQVFEDPEWAQIREFEGAYQETMARVGATDNYSFSHDSLMILHDRLGPKIKLFHAALDNQIIGSSIFFVCNDIIQYHLGATYSEWTQLSPGTAILDYVRLWGAAQGLRWFHLGGGVEGNEDAVFRFKSGMSKLRRVYPSASVIVDTEGYDLLCDARQKLIGPAGSPGDVQDFFPEYRAPLEFVDSQD